MAGDQDHVSPSVPGTTREDLRKALLAERERCQLPEDATAEEDQAFEDEKQSLQIKLIQNRGRSHEPDFTSFRKAIMLALALNDSLDDNDEWLQHANDMASEDVCESILEDLGDELRHMHCRGIDDAPDIWSHNDIIISRLAEAGFVDEDCTDNEWYSKDEDEETDDLDGSNEDTNGSEGESEQDTERRQVQNGPEDSDVEMTDAESG